MDISLIAAMAADRVIGKDNHLPWQVSTDLKHFKALTIGKPVIMGRKTYESMGRPLPDRKNIIISRNANFDAPGCQVASSLEAAIDLAKPAPEIMIIGGAQLYQQALPIANRMYLTLLDLQIDGDTFFPAWPATQWQVTIEENFVDEKSGISGTFLTLEKHV